MAPIGRLYGFLLIFALCSIALVARAINLQVVDTEYLQDQGEARYLRDVTVPTPRGKTVPKETLLDAAELAVFFSRKRKADWVEFCPSPKPARTLGPAEARVPVAAGELGGQAGEVQL